MQRVYVALVEVVPLDGCELSPIENAGASVRCYILAETRDDAMGSLRATLTRDRFEFRHVEFCELFDAEWEREDNGVDGMGVDDARESGGVAFGTFHCWGHDAPDAYDTD